MLSHPTTIITMGSKRNPTKVFLSCVITFSPGSINLSRRGHQIIQIIEKGGFSLTHPLLKKGVKKNYIKSFLVMSGNFFVPGYTNVSQRVLEIIPKKLKYFKISKK